MSMHGYARGLLQKTPAVSASPAEAPTHAAANQIARSGGGGGGGTAAPVPPSHPSPISPFDVNSQFSPTMIIILVILLSAFFFMGFFAVYVRRCTGDDSFSRRGTSRSMTRRDESATAQRGLGVDPLLVQSFPMVSYAVAKKKGCSECVVCLADFEGGEELKQLPKCKHVFHPGCIGLWLESHTTCPLCRRSLVSSDRWSVSLRWGGSSRGGSLSTRLNEEGSSVSRRGGETSSARFGRAGSSTGWRLREPGQNDDGSSRGNSQEESSPHVLDVSPSCELAPRRLSATSEIVTRGLPPSLPSPGLSPRGHQASSAPPRGSQASSFPSNLMLQSPGLMQASPLSSEVAANASLLSSEVASRVPSEGTKPQPIGASQGRRRLRRSNSTGHSLRKGAVSRAAVQAQGGSGWATSCVPLSVFPLHRSRSMRLDGPEEEEAMVGTSGATSEKGLLSGGRWTPQEACPVSKSAPA